MKKLNNIGKGVLKVAGAIAMSGAGGHAANAIVKAVPTPMGKVAATIGVNVLYAPVLCASVWLANKGVDQIVKNLD